MAVSMKKKTEIVAEILFWGNKPTVYHVGEATVQYCPKS